MKLMKIIGIALISLPIIANAGNLKIANNTKYDLSFQINNTCSNRIGTIHSHSTKIISEKEFNAECEYNPKYCTAKVYNNLNCSGENIAGVGFDTSSGIIYLSGSTSSSINISGNGFNLVFAEKSK